MTITVRRPTFVLSSLPVHWVGSSRIGTWFGNAGHVFIPLGEQMFIDAVKAVAPAGRTPRAGADTLDRQVRAFIGQEAVHARIHESVWSTLRSQGVPVDHYASLINAFRSGAEPFVSPALLLATTAALEHYTAAFGAAFLSEDLDRVLPPEMADLLRWHGAEEIEHRSVAFDVLQTVDDSFGLRLAGMAMATALLLAIPAVGVGLFGWHDLTSARHPRLPRLPNPQLAGMSVRFLRTVSVEVARYLHPDFHPARQPEPEPYHRWRADWSAAG